MSSTARLLEGRGGLLTCPCVAELTSDLEGLTNFLSGAEFSDDTAIFVLP